MAKHKHHHGGAWKVAYADFITTMMALFLVLWLTAQDVKIKEAIERSFKNPFSSLTKESVGIIPNQQEAQATHQEKGNYDSPSAVQLELLRRVAEDLAKLLQNNPEDQVAVKLEMTPDGLRINIFDRTRRPIFEPDTTVFTQYGSWVFQTMAWVVARYQSFTVELEGHTEAGTKSLRPDYSQWELSTDRANATRRKLLDYGVAADQIFKISGYGETQPMAGVAPTDEANRRVTVLLRIRSGDRNGDSQTPPKPTSSPP
jgi:chemotaxis protein MotB